MSELYEQLTRNECEALRGRLLQEQSSFVDHWKQLADFVMPRRFRQWQHRDRNRGDRRNQKIIDSTATLALRNLRSGMHAGITSPARPWMKLTTPDPDLAESPAVKDWLHIVTARMLTVFLRSNLYNTLPTIYGDMGLFATSAMSVLEDDNDLIRCFAFPCASYLLGLNERMVADTFIRQYQLTVKQIVKMFGVVKGTRDVDWTNISPIVKALWDRGAYEDYVDVSWLVAPNENHDPGKLEPKYLPFMSVHWEMGDGRENKYLKESGFNEFPVLAPRWDVAAEDTYGTDCPGMTALGDIRALQIMQRRKGQAVEKMINPPLQAPMSMSGTKVSMLAGEVNYVDALGQQQGIRPVQEISMSIKDLTLDIRDSRELIQRAFYEDLFLMLAETDRREITAREIDERHEEKLLALGPVLERAKDELHDPLIARTYGTMLRAGLIPKPPQELNGVPLRVEHLSIMAQAQKLVGAAGQERFFSSLLPIVVEAFPEAKYKVKIFQSVQDLADMYGVNPKQIRSDDEAQQMLDAANQAAAKQQQAEQAATMAKGARDLANSPTGANADNALATLMSGQQAS